MFVAEISKAVDMYMFLFDDILLLTRVKKSPRKVTLINSPPQCGSFTQ